MQMLKKAKNDGVETAFDRTAGEHVPSALK
jgi:hypothetical protein